MFKFNFDFEEVEGDSESLPVQKDELDPAVISEETASTSTIPSITCTEILLSTLLSELPPFVSYSTISIPLSDGTTTKIWKRELYDARYQVVASTADDSDSDSSESEGEQATKESDGDKPKKEKKERKDNREKEEEPSLEALDNPSDLLPGIYEGGLKTWECSLDLASYLQSTGYPDGKGKGKQRVLELGCGTGVPSVWLLQEVFKQCRVGSGNEHGIEVWLQDYNADVLRLLTLPNILLAYHRSGLPTRTESDHDDLELPPSLIESFSEFLQSHKITLRFFAGGWDTFIPMCNDGFNLILTSETIYSVSSLPKLLSLLKAASKVVADSKILVAAKSVYFGVGGGEREFRRLVEKDSGSCDCVWKGGSDGGVERIILKVDWNSKE